MLKRLLPIALLASTVMILGCPGQPCGPGTIYDCARNCVDESNATDSAGDGSCDEAFNCSAFDYDGGDCDNYEVTTTTTSDYETTTTTSDSETTTTTSQPDDGKTLKGWRMEAQLVVHFVCKLPPIDKTATIALSGYENGDVVGENGFFAYNSDADYCNGGNWHRDGHWNINPFGRMVVHEGAQWLELNENTYHFDNIVIECPPGTTQPPIQEDGTWNEGLFMQLADGANNTVTNGRGDEISWTLQGVAVQEMIP